jgi:rod shape-determining protein MreD
MSPNPYFTIPFLLIVAILQSTAAPRLTVSGVRPDLMLVSVVSWTLLAAFRARELQYIGEPPSLWRGINDGVVWGFVGGMFLDLLSGAPWGISALALMAAAMVVGILSVGIAGSAPILMIVVTPLGTFAYHLVFLIGIALTGRPVFWSMEVTRVILPGIVFNLALTPVIYLLLNPLNRQTERERLQW